VIRLLPVAGIVFAVVTSVAHADRAAADRCAAALSPYSKAIYARSLSDLLSDQSITDVVSTVTRAMVFAGSLPVGDARAADCLKLVR
jgi:hypothetical protein